MNKQNITCKHKSIFYLQFLSFILGVIILSACHHKKTENDLLAEKILSNNWKSDNGTNHFRVDTFIVLRFEMITDKELSEIPIGVYKHKIELLNNSSQEDSIRMRIYDRAGDTKVVASLLDSIRSNNSKRLGYSKIIDSLASALSDPVSKKNYLVLARISTSSINGRDSREKWFRFRSDFKLCSDRFSDYR